MPLIFSKRHYPKDFKALIESKETALIKRSEMQKLLKDTRNNKPTHGPSELVKFKPQLVFWKDPKDQEKPTRVRSEPRNLREQTLQKHLAPNSRFQRLNLREQTLQKHPAPNSRHQRLNLRGQRLQEHPAPNSRHQRLNLRGQRLQEHPAPNGRFQRLNLRSPNHRGSDLVRAGSALLLAPHKVRYHYGELIPCRR